MSVTLSSIAQMHFHDRLQAKGDKKSEKPSPKRMNLQMEIQQRTNMDDDQNSCGTSISNSIDNSNDSDLENDHPTLVPSSLSHEDINTNEESMASMFQPAQDIVKKEFPLEFGFSGSKTKKDSEDLISSTFPGTSTRSPFLLPAQLYKNFFASLGKRRTGPDAECPAAGFQVYPRNMLFSTGNRPTGGLFFNGSDDENGERVTDSPVDEVFYTSKML